jgi:hypothetical protein
VEDAGVSLRPAAGWPWPEMSARRRIGATAGEVMAVYADLAAHAQWMPGVLASRVAGRPARDTFRVDYEYDNPGPNERYTVDMRLARPGEAWEASWMLVQARFARRLAGLLRVEPHGGGALLTYVTRVDPGALGLALGSPDSTARRLQETLAALAARVAEIKRQEPARLERMVRQLQRGAAGPLEEDG